jgi:hypothetical protein
MGARNRAWYLGFGLGLLALCQLAQVSAQPGMEVAPVPAIKITNTNYVAANGGKAATADPEGTYEKPVDGIDWRVEWAYGTGSGKDFKMSDVAIGGGYKLPDEKKGAWGKIGAENLKSVPANLHVRVQLLRSENKEWKMKAEDYKSIP